MTNKETVNRNLGLLFDFVRERMKNPASTCRRRPSPRAPCVSAGRRNSRAHITNYKVWQDGNHPVELSASQVIDERLHYLHYNPVEAGLVWEPEIIVTIQ